MTKRFYSGMRNDSRLGEAAKLKRLEIQKGGKLPITAAERYKKVIKQKLVDHQEEAARNRTNQFNLPGTKPLEKKLSQQAEQAMRQIAMRKARKDEKALKKMVVVKPQNFPYAGRMDKKGNIYDVGGNLTMKVDLKTGKVKTMGGMTIAHYSSKDQMRTTGQIKDALLKFGPYFVQQKRLQLLQEHERQAQLNGYGNNVWGAASEQFIQEHYTSHGSTAEREEHHRSANVTAWGAMSKSVMGVQADNIWGTVADNVWGGTDSNVWGGLGGTNWGKAGAWSGRSATRIGPIIKGLAGVLKPMKLLFGGLLGKRRLNISRQARAPKVRMRSR